MARAARAPRTPKTAEPVPAEPDLLDAPPPREATALFSHEESAAALAGAFGRAAGIPQALLLEGPRGIGKATLAFRLAKALLERAPGQPIDPRLTSDPNGRASQQVAAGTHPSLLHLMRPYDFEKKRFRQTLTVDEVRRIVPFLGSTAAAGGWRIVLVDALDDMNLNAANALLKSLEEPPRRTLFLLIAHVAGTVLPTIRSRCRSVRLRPVPEADIARALTHLGLDPALARFGEGSVRRAALMAGTGAETVRTVERLLAPAALRKPHAHQRLGDLAAARREGEFSVVMDLVQSAIAARARDHAAGLPLGALDAYAALHGAAGSERRTVEEYNLDRKELVLSLCARLAAADAAAGLT